MAVALSQPVSPDEAISDEDLTTLALAADPTAVLAADAMSVWDLLGIAGEHSYDARLPEWYMPAPMAGARPVRRRWHRFVAVAIIASFVLINILGLCITYGQLVAA